MRTRNYLPILAGLTAVFLFAGCQRSAIQPVEPTAAEAAASKPDTKPAPAKPQVILNEYKVSWNEECEVEQAFAAASKVLEDLGLRLSPDRTRTVPVRDPRTGRTIAQTVPVSDRYGATDALSAFLETTTTGQIKLEIRMLFMPPDSSEIAITATSASQPEHVLKKQSDYLKQRISEKIQQPMLSEEPVPYPQTMTFDSSPDAVHGILIQWADRKGFRRETSSESDRYYKTLLCSSASVIRFQFTMRLVDENETRLEIKIDNYQGKGEFKMILRELLESLESVETQPNTAQEPVPYPEELILNADLPTVSAVLAQWMSDKQFNPEQSSGDRFTRSAGCTTASQIRFRFYMKLMNDSQTKLRIYVSNYKDKEDFPLILKSLEDVLKKLKQDGSPEASSGEQVFPS